MVEIQRDVDRFPEYSSGVSRAIGSVAVRRRAGAPGGLPAFGTGQECTAPDSLDSREPENGSFPGGVQRIRVRSRSSSKGYWSERPLYSHPLSRIAPMATPRAP
jgi:hypothetical protein